MDTPDEGLDDDPATQLDAIEEDDPPPDFVEDDAPVQQFRRQRGSRLSGTTTSSMFMPQETEEQTRNSLRRPSLSTSSPHSITEKEAEVVAHDAFWGHLFVLSLSGLFATAFLVYLQTSLPGRGSWRWGDTIYNTIHKSYFLLGTVLVFAATYMYSIPDKMPMASLLASEKGRTLNDNESGRSSSTGVDEEKGQFGSA